MPAHILEACGLAAALYAMDGTNGAGTLLEFLRRLLPRKGKEKEGAEPETNTHVFALRCLSLIPGSMWHKGLTEAHMAAIMAGIDSSDATVRRAVGLLSS